MRKEYELIKVYYIDGERIEILDKWSPSFQEIVKRYNKLMRKKRKRYTCDIMEQEVSEWVNIDYDNVLGFK